jgi:hypothetical protein
MTENDILVKILVGAIGAIILMVAMYVLAGAWGAVVVLGVALFLLGLR